MTRDKSYLNCFLQIPLLIVSDKNYSELQYKSHSVNKWCFYLFQVTYYIVLKSGWYQ